MRPAARASIASNPASLSTLRLPSLSLPATAARSVSTPHRINAVHCVSTAMAHVRAAHGLTSTGHGPCQHRIGPCQYLTLFVHPYRNVLSISTAHGLYMSTSTRPISQHRTSSPTSKPRIGCVNAEDRMGQGSPASQRSAFPPLSPNPSASSRADPRRQYRTSRRKIVGS